MAAAIAAWMARRYGFVTGLLAGTGVALSIFFIDKSRLGAIDHHFLEFPLTVGIIATAAALARARAMRSALRYGGLFAVAIACALFVQPALLLSAGVALLGVFFFERGARAPRAAAGIGFALASAFVFLYRAVQPSGYPDNEWNLGVPHAAALLAAAVACAGELWSLDAGFSRARSLAVALGISVLTITAIPGAIGAVLGGSTFLGGDPWFRSISEFRPLFSGPESVWFLDLCLLGGGALLTIPLVASPGWRQGSRRLYLLFAVGYLAAALSSKRFLVIAGPLLAVSGALVYFDLRRRGHRKLALASAVLLLAPSIVLSAGRVLRPAPAIGPEGMPMVRAAEALSRDRRTGGVLAPWSWGHLFNVVADRGVIVDNFGTMSGRTDFENATAITLATREKAVADYCSANGVRFLILQDPLPYFAAHAEMSGFPRSAFEWPLASGTPTRLTRSTFWWRAYFEGGRRRPGAGPAGAAFERFRLVAVEKEPAGSEIRSAVQIWEVLSPPGPTGP
jgi:asparagine N-glycosylation enzyme membrane subunit Stt3